MQHFKLLLFLWINWSAECIHVNVWLSVGLVVVWFLEALVLEGLVLTPFLIWSQEDFFCIVNEISWASPFPKYHTHFFLTWKKIKGGSISFAAWLCLCHEGNFERLLLTKWCFILRVGRICNKNPAILSIWADSASSQHKSTYITSLSESSVRCTSAVLIFMKFLLSFSSCIWMCDWNISSRLPLFICRKCRRVCWNVLQWKQSPFHVRFWLGVSAIQLNEG